MDGSLADYAYAMTCIPRIRGGHRLLVGAFSSLTLWGRQHNQQMLNPPNLRYIHWRWPAVCPMSPTFGCTQGTPHWHKQVPGGRGRHEPLGVWSRGWGHRC